MAFRVGVTRDLLARDSSGPLTDIGLELLDQAPGVKWEFLARDVDVLTAELIAGYDALFVEAPAVSAEALRGVSDLAVIARFGVGYDKVDVAACTEAGVLLSIQPDAVRRPVAISAVALLLAVTHHLVPLDRLTREGRWNDRGQYFGVGLVGRTLGAVGLGSIGRELLGLIAPFGLRIIAYDPYCDPAVAATSGATLVSLETLCTEADFVVLMCPLTPETRNLFDERRLRSMKPRAFLVNIARGGIVDQAALTRVLLDGHLGGAALDVVEPEPIDPADPILQVDRTVITPHWLAWTDQCLYDCGRSACEAILEVAAGSPPRNLVNPQVLEHPRLQTRLRTYAARSTDTGTST